MQGVQRRQDLSAFFVPQRSAIGGQQMEFSSCPIFPGGECHPRRFGINLGPGVGFLVGQPGQHAPGQRHVAQIECLAHDIDQNVVIAFLFGQRFQLLTQALAGAFVGR